MSAKSSTPTDVRRPCPQVRRLINGTLIDNIRRNQELTVEEYAHTCGVPFKTMKRICAGRNVPNGEHLLRIIRFGGVSPKLLEIDGWKKWA